jgi:hypothetical protein
VPRRLHLSEQSSGYVTRLQHVSSELRKKK